MGKKVDHIIKFFTTDIWRISQGDVSPVKFLFLEIAKKLLLAVRFFTAKRVMQKASALTYSTLLAIVPIMAVVFAIARGFGYSKYIEVWFRDAFESQPQVAEVIIGFVNSYLVHTKSGVFLGIGLLFMLYTVLMLVSNVEDAFNEIWQVKKPRSIFRTFTDYLPMFFLFLIIIVLTSGISIFMANIADLMPDFLLLGPTLRFMIDLIPYLLMSGMFIALYIFMPNTHVKPINAFFPGILAGSAMQGLQIIYIHSQIFLSRICKRFEKGQKPLTALELSEQTTIPIRIVNDLLYEQMQANLIVEISNDEKGETSRYMPAEDINHLTLGVMVDRLESFGTWKIDLDVSELFSEEWGKAIELRSIYLRDARKILLQDLFGKNPVNQ